MQCMMLRAQNVGGGAARSAGTATKAASIGSIRRMSDRLALTQVAR